MPVDAVYELNEFIAAYRRIPKGFEDWQIPSRIAIVIASAIKRCKSDELAQYISTALDASGIDRYAVRSAYIHGLSPNIVEVLYHIFPNMAPRVGANAPMITQLPAVKTPTVAANTAPPPSPPAATAEAKEELRRKATSKRPPAAGPGEVVLRVGSLAEHETQLGTVRLPLSVMERLGLKSGDFVELTGTKSTYAVAQPTDEEDVVKMDEVTRSNVGAELGDYVRVKKAVLPPAEKIVLRANQPVGAEYVKRYLLFKPLARGNITAVPQQDKTITLRVEDVVPAPVAYVQLSTEIEIRHNGMAQGKQQQPEGELMYKSSAPEALRVFEAKTQDSGRSIVRIPIRIMKRLGVEPGDYIEIVGRKSAYAQVWPAYPEDEDKDIIRMDGMIRQNAGVGIGDTVKVRRISLRPAQRVVLAPTEPVRVDPEYLKKQILLGKPIVGGQAIDIPIQGGSIRFVVVQVQPGPAAYVSVDTEVTVREAEVIVKEKSSSRDLSISQFIGRDLYIVGTADLFRAFGFFLLFASFIYIITNHKAIYSTMFTLTLFVGYFASAVIAPVVLIFARRRAWASALIGILGLILLLVYMPKVSSLDLTGALFTFAILWLIISAIISMQAELEKWSSGRFYATLAGAIGVGYIVLAIAKTIDAIRHYARAA
jgi:antitoxin component of MazEF toxin-antitoxin module